MPIATSAGTQDARIHFPNPISTPNFCAICTPIGLPEVAVIAACVAYVACAVVRPVRRLAGTAWRIGLGDLSVLGPILVLKLKDSPEDFGRRLVAELWLYPDGSRIFELSTKCEPSEAFEVAAEIKAFLTSRGVDLGADQQTKTRTALEFFASDLGGTA